MRTLAAGWLLLWCVIAFQTALFAERILNTTLCVVVGAEKSPAAALAARQVLAQAWGWLAQVVAAALAAAAGAFDVFARNVSLLVSALLIFAVALALADSGLGMFAVTLNAYNSGIGLLIDALVVKPLQLANVLLGPLLAVFNGFTFFTKGLLPNVLLPVMQQGVDGLPALVENSALATGAIAYSTSEFLQNVLECAGGSQDARCYASANHLALDLMTPGAYVKEVVRAALVIVTSSCPAARGALAILLYPALDFNLYRTVHCLVNAALATLLQGVVVARRCAYAERSQIQQAFSDGERAVMCTVDWHVPAQLLVAASLASGRLQDNWLNAGIALAEREIVLASGGVYEPLCAPVLPLADAWENAGSVFAGLREASLAGPPLVVPLTDSVIAFTDGQSTAFYADYGEATQSGTASYSLAFEHWPLAIDTHAGVAAVQYSAAGNEDSAGASRTGLLGCRCVDEETGPVIACAAVPFVQLADEGTGLMSLAFEHENALAGLTCSQLDVRVQALRFARDRLSSVSAAASDVQQNVVDDGDERASVDGRDGATLSADALVYVAPLCTTAQACFETASNCFPFCMGLRLASQTSGRVHMFRAATWRDRVFLMQTDCAVQAALDDPFAPLCEAEAAGAGLSVVSTEDTGDRAEWACGLVRNACVPEDAAITLKTALLGDDEDKGTQEQRDALLVVKSAQPLVVAGDVMVFEVDALAPAEGTALITTRLFNTRAGLRQERLSWVADANAVPVHECDVSTVTTAAAWAACTRAAVSMGKIVLPSPVRALREPTTGATTLSRWAAHWAENADTALLRGAAESCAGTTSGIALGMTGTWRTPRVWTLRTARASGMGLGIAASEERVVAFVSVPDFAGPETPCEAVVNLRVVALEYINDQNLLLTTEAGTIASLAEGAVRSEPVYHHYYVHPNEHRCADTSAPDDADPNAGALVHTCVRAVAGGMFPAPGDAPAVLETATAGVLCPAADRAPRLGSAVAHVGAAAVIALKSVMEFAFLVPALLVRGQSVGVLFEERQQRTHVAVLDTTGNTFLDLDAVFLHLDQSAMHTWHSLERVAVALRGEPGGAVVEGVLIGTARVLQHSQYGDVLSDALLKQLSNAVRVPTAQLLTRFRESVLASPLGKLPPALQGAQAMGARALNAARANANILRGWIVLALRRSGLLRAKAVVRQGTGRALTATVATSARQALARGVTDVRAAVRRFLVVPARAQCSGFGLMLGGTNPVALVLRHACDATVDGIEGGLTVLSYLFAGYPAMRCACALGEGEEMGLAARSVCAEQLNSFENQLWTRVVARSSDASEVCGAALQLTSQVVRGAFDPMLARLERLADALARSLDLVTIAFDENAGQCSVDATSPYVVTMLPSPTDYFMACRETGSCRTRCLQEYEAFELALERQSAVTPPTQTVTLTQELTSMYFSADDLEAGLHLPPFEIFALSELPPSVCRQMCDPSREPRADAHETARCVGVAGRAVLQTVARARVPQAPQVAYYCIPRDISQFVRRIETPVQGVYDTAAYPSTRGALVEAQFVTVGEREHGRRDVLLVVEQHADADVTQTVALLLPATEAAPALRIDLFNTTTVPAPLDEPEAVSLVDLRVRRVLHVRVLPALSTKVGALVYMIVEKESAARTEEGRIEGNTVMCVQLIVPADPSRVEFASDVQRLAIKKCAGERAVPARARVVCLADSDATAPCEDELWVPTDRAAPVRRVAMSHEYATDERPWEEDASESQPPAALREALASTLSLRTRTTVYETASGAGASARTHVSVLSFRQSDTSDGVSTVDVLLARPAGATLPWLENARLENAPGTDGLSSTWAAVVGASERVARRVDVELECSTANCAGCRGAEGSAARVELHALCVVAQDCALRRCVGTTINLRRPLCNVGQAIAQALRLYNAGLGAVWAAAAGYVVQVSEISIARVPSVEVLWVEDAFTTATCIAKDVVHETAAVVVSSIGAVHTVQRSIEQAVALETQSARSALSDTRASAVFMMTLEAFGGLLARIMMAPVYGALVTQHVLACSVTDVVMAVTLAMDEDAEEPFVRFISARTQAALEDGVTMCLAKRTAQAVQDIGMQAEYEALRGTPVALMMDLHNVLPFQLLDSVSDGLFSWALGVVDGIMDVAQTLDFRNCRLPAAVSRRVEACVCGDRAARIPDAQRVDSALWCTGLLRVYDAMGEPVVVLNPYSYAELLQQAAQLDDYLQCLAQRQEGCRAPSKPALTQQGVDTVQVVNLCRSNYEQKTWDAAASELGLLDADEWAAVLDGQAPLAVLSFREDGRDRQRLRVATLVQEHWASKWEALLSARPGVLTCLRSETPAACAFADANGRVAAAFAYELVAEADSLTYSRIDACQSMSGLVQPTADAGPRSPTLWTARSGNAQPLASSHNLALEDAAAREAAADAKLEYLFESIQEDLAAWVLDDPKNARVEIDTLFSEGDALHQLVDCVILGPFASARVHHGLSAAANAYHRGDPLSREFAARGGPTLGSAVRRHVISELATLANEETQTAFRTELVAWRRQVAAMWGRRENLRCACADGAPSVGCCAAHPHPTQSFANYDTLTGYNLQNEIEENIWDSIVTGELLTEKLWSDPAFAPPVTPSREEDDLLARDAGAFTAERVQHYSAEEAKPGNHTLWHGCMLALQRSYMTLPLSEDGGADLPNSTFDRDQSADHGVEFTHAMEPLVRDVLARMHRDSPVYWSDAVRYMPTEGRWCEQHSDGLDSHVNVGEAAAWATGKADQHTMSVDEETAVGSAVRAINYDDVVLPADFAVRCLCGWEENGDLPAQCTVPTEMVEKLTDVDTDDETVVLITGRYTHLQHQIRLYHLLREHKLMHTCAPLAVHWGLLADDEVAAWFGGEAKTAVQRQHVATHGPAGVRLAMLKDADWMRSVATGVLVTQWTEPFWNSAYNHSVAQPMCGRTALQSILQDADLRKRLQDVFVPAALPVRAPTAEAACARWAVERALLFVLESAGNGIEGYAQCIVGELEAQRTTERTWRARCETAAREVALCELRGVFDIAPESAKTSLGDADKCGFTVAPTAAALCGIYFVTPNCLVRCGAEFLDPCRVSGTCTGLEVSNLNTDSFKLPLWSELAQLLPRATVLDSMRWPTEIPPGEHGTSPVQLAQDLHQARTAPPPADEEWHNLLWARLDALITRDTNLRTEQHIDPFAAPGVFGDGLVDYWPGDAQVPVGYHPTTACRMEDTNVRGFLAHMTADAGDHNSPTLDHTRPRNATAAATFAGAAHLLCDAGTYGAYLAAPDGLYLETRWGEHTADPAVPGPAMPSSERAWSIGGANQVQDQFAVPALEHLSDVAEDPRPRAAAGLVRDWLNTHGRIQTTTQPWPHSWERVPWYGTREDTPDTCAAAPLKGCDIDTDCAGDLVCRKHDAGGICAMPDTCFRHAHCPEHELCGGDGRCREPTLYVRNDLPVTVDVRLFGAPGVDLESAGLGANARVARFAQDNGLCSLGERNAYLDRVQASSLTESKNHAESESALLYPVTANVADGPAAPLWQTPSECDRSYQFAGRDALTLRTVAVLNTQGQALDTASVLRPWRRDDSADTWKALLCDTVLEASKVTPLLSPYRYVDATTGFQTDTLAHTPSTVQRCTTFETCSPMPFAIANERVQTRYVLHPQINEDNGRISLNTERFRAHTPRDAVLCWGAGLVVRDVGTANAFCMLDLLVVPHALAAFFPDSLNGASSEVWPTFNEYLSLAERRARFEKLRGHCPRAFGEEAETAFDYFTTAFTQLSHEWPSAQSAAATLAANKLFPQLFGVMHASERGFGDEAHYLQHSQCAQYVLQRGAALRAALLARPYHPYLRDAALQPVVPGLSHYLFVQRAPVYVPTRWLWQCVVLNKAIDGGAPLTWLEQLGSAGASGIQCEAFHQYATHRSSGNARPVTLQKFLATRPEIFVAHKEVDATQESLHRHFERIASNAVDALLLRRFPDVNCLAPPVDSSCNPDPAATTPIFFPSPEQAAATCAWRKLSSRDPTAVLDDATVAQSNLYATLRERMFGVSSDADLFQTLQSLQANSPTKLLVRGLTEMVSYDADVVPKVYFSTAVQITDAELAAEARNIQYNTDDDRFQFGDTPTVYAVRAGVDSACRMAWDTRSVAGAPLQLHELDTVYELRHNEYVRISGSLPAPRGGDDDEQSIYFTQLQAQYLVIQHVLDNIALEPLFQGEMLRRADEVFDDAGWTGEDGAVLLASAQEYDSYLANLGFVCPASTETIDVQAETSLTHMQLRACVRALTEPVSWLLVASDTLQATPQSSNAALAASLRAGLHVSFIEARDEASFLEDLFSERVAEKVDPVRALCFRDGDRVRSINPVWAGAFDFATGCDTVLDSATSTRVRFVSADKGAANCEELSSATLSYEGTLTADSTPLCQRTPATDSACAAGRWGTLNGNRGVPQGANVFEVREVHIPRSLFSVTNTVARFNAVVDGPTESAVTDVFALADSDIAGDVVVFRISSTGVLALDRLVLNPAQTQTPLTQPLRVQEWLTHVETIAWRREHSAVARERPVPAGARALPWTCPVQRMMRYSGESLLMEFSTTHSRPRIPDPARNRARFAHITGDAFWVHPTVMSAQDLLNHQRGARYVAEWLACADDENGVLGDACRAESQDLRDALDFATDMQWRTFVLRGEPLCTEILDWPHQRFTTRDRVEQNAEYGTAVCSVLGRLAPFQLRLQRQRRRAEVAATHDKNPAQADASAAWAARSETLRPENSAHPCRMGRLPRVSYVMNSNLVDQDCVRRQDGYTCRALDIGTGVADTRNHGIAQASAPTEAQPARTLLSACTAHEHAGLRVRDKGRDIAQEHTGSDPLLSVGRPFHLPPGRAIAAHARAALRRVAQQGECPIDEQALHDNLHETTWRDDSFLQHLRDQLLPSPSTTEDTHERLWARPWLYCKNASACAGSVSYGEWKNPATRRTQCQAGMVAARIELQDSRDRAQLNPCFASALDAEMCAKVVDWRDTVAQTLCEASGDPDCARSAFFYTPTTFSTANRRFVHDSVREFYQEMAPAEYATCDVDADTEQLEVDAAALALCASKRIAPLRVMLDAMREMRALVIEIMMYMGRVSSSLVMLLFAVAGETVTQQGEMLKEAGDRLVINVMLVLAKVADIMEQVARAIFAVVFAQGVPREIFDALQNVICPALKIILKIVVGEGEPRADDPPGYERTPGVLCTVLGWLEHFFTQTLGANMRQASNVPLLQFLSPIADGCTAVGRVFEAAMGSMCVLRENMCEFFNENAASASERATLPVATRCWATYTTYFGDSQALSCRATDTCRASVLGSMTADLSRCAECAGGFNCHHVTHTCTCDVPTYEQTPCTANYHCLEAPNCKLAMSAALSATALPCTACSNARYCHLTDQLPGTCACGITPVAWHACRDASVGQAVRLNIEQTCLVSVEASYTGTSTSSADFASLVATPCENLIESDARCMRVEDAGVFMGHYVVGTRTIASASRRLLAADEDVAPEYDAQTLDPLCRDALMADAATLQNVRNECRRAAARSRSTLASLRGVLGNATDSLPECTFCSAADALNALVRAPWLLPALAARPRMLFSIAATHLPMFRALRAWRDALDVLVVDAQALLNVSRDGLVSDNYTKFDHHVPARRLLAAGADFAQRWAQMVRVHKSQASALADAFDYNFVLTDPGGERAAVWAQSFPPELGAPNASGARPSSNECPPLEAAVRLAADSANSTLRYFLVDPAVPEYSLQAAWPSPEVDAPPPEGAAHTRSVSTLLQAVVDLVRTALDWIGLAPASIAAFWEAAVNEGSDFVRCDMDAVQTCSRWRVRLAPGIAISALWMSLAYAFCSAVGVPFFATLAAPLFPVLVAYVCYGYSALCAPTVPTCLLQDVYETLADAFPKHITLERAFFKSDDCVAQYEIDNVVHAECLTSCAEAPWSYLAWQDPLAWLLAELGHNAQTLVLNVLDYVPLYDNDMLSEAIALRTALVHTASPGVIMGNRLCALASSWMLIPAAIVVVLFLGVLVVVAQAACTLLYPTAMLAAAYVVHACQLE